ncbi:uncharacterized protein LOC123451213 [Hordeum vulgare subsp. vulgare]|uniref:Uncharacterized protein n=1 Tax=Hordeum vulgare subsp. vulgare TaxID=112509 RepID=A0A8I6XD05_HORVV|nr:uncharacterized protein LOC123451213 [Hordeum vulgare subsp. vulgare]
MRVVGAAKPERMPSVEREPKTLSLGELNYAREAALYVLTTHSWQDAARIFTEGLKQVHGVRRSSTDSDDDDDDEEGDVFDPDALVDDHDARHRRLRGRVAKKRDFATAPF